MTRQIPEERKTAYYAGMVLVVMGGILFASAFVTAAIGFGDFSNFESRARSQALRAFGGMALMIAGAVVRGIAARGLAGSGVILDPERARDELEPYSRMVGGMLKDALHEADVSLGGKPVKVVMVKCPSCGKLNEEDSKFCRECGGKL